MLDMKHTLNSILLAGTFFLVGCNSTQSNIQVDQSLADNAFFKQHKVETQNDVFRLDSKITSKLTSYFNDGPPHLSQAEALMQFLVDNGEASMAYQSNANLTASEAFDNLNANCLSLSILAYSLSEFLGFDGQFQRVHIPEYWDQTQGYSLLTGHVNLVVSEANRSLGAAHVLYSKPKSITIDFDPNSREQDFPVSNITKNRILSMFYSNKGAMALIDKDYDLAYSYFKAAINTDPYYSGAWGNLGIVFRVTGFEQQAEQVYKQALALNPQNSNVLGNLALLYKMTDREAAGDQILARLDDRRKSNPYYQIVKGNEAISANKLSEALAYFRQAKKLDSRLHDSYFGMAKVYYLRGEIELSKHYLSKAYEYSNYEHDRTRYQGKLQWLQAVAKN
ncbi:tetratricopeptide repeat protein [Pseudoalteromonas sp. A25]|uniref:tetratricopeptide repeat protein n=1 Tax=Pseudoalteromonas sp. A25 TaxID=116092 RepID=UPI001E36D585|nr:tetratricopeptide repeat protein [Pseudoalteromonas sp. A25]